MKNVAPNSDFVGVFAFTELANCQGSARRTHSPISPRSQGRRVPPASADCEFSFRRLHLHCAPVPQCRAIARVPILPGSRCAEHPRGHHT